MTEATVLVERDEGVTTITLNRPDKLNALSVELLGELRESLQAAADDPACRCVLLTGAGRGFSAGADLADTGSGLKPGERPDFGATLETRYHPILRLIRGMQKPVIAAVNGTAAGAGLNIALACDVVIAARSAKLIQAFIKIGLVPDAGGTWTIPRLIGPARAARWMMSGEPLTAGTATEWGLIAEAVDDEDLPAAARDLARTMAAQPTVAVAGIKRLLDASATNDLEAQIALEARTQSEVGYSDDTLEGITAFLQKRPPAFKGR